MNIPINLFTKVPPSIFLEVSPGNLGKNPLRRLLEVPMTILLGNRTDFFFNNFNWKILLLFFQQFLRNFCKICSGNAPRRSFRISSGCFPWNPSSNAFACSSSKFWTKLTGKSSRSSPANSSGCWSVNLTRFFFQEF